MIQWKFTLFKLAHPLGGLLLCIILPLSTFAQIGDPSFIHAQKEYELGNFQASIDTLLRRLEQGDDNLKWNTQRLLCLNYLASNQKENARKAAKSMLTIAPTYRSSALRDPAEFRKLLESFLILPKWKLGISIAPGSNLTLPRINKIYSNVELTKKYTGLAAYQFGISSSYQMHSSLALQFGVLASANRYKIDYSISGWDLHMNESMTYLNIPLSIEFSPSLKGPFLPYVQAGAFIGYYLYGESSFYAKFKEDGTEYQLANIQSKDRRMVFNYGIQAAFGTKYRKRNGEFFVQLTYFRSMNDLVNSSARYKYSELQYDYFYIDDNFQLDNLALTFGYSHFLSYKIESK